MNRICAQCDAECTRVVTLELELGRMQFFCSDRCEHKWMKAELVRRGTFLNRIYILARGVGRRLAQTALHTSTPP